MGVLCKAWSALVSIEPASSIELSEAFKAVDSAQSVIGDTGMLGVMIQTKAHSAKMTYVVDL